MPYRKMTWKYKLFLMVYGLLIQLVIIYILCTKRGFSLRYVIMISSISLISLFLLLIFYDRFRRKKFKNKEDQLMELKEDGDIDAVPQNPPIRMRNKITFRKILLVCCIGICVLSTVSTLFRDGADGHNRRGLAHYKAGETDKAISEFTKAIEINPRFAKAYYNRGSVYALSNDNNKAIADLTMAVKLKPTLANAFNCRGLAYLKLGEREIAIRDFTRTIRIKPEHAGAYASRGAAYAGKHENEMAIADCTKAIEIDPGLAEAYNTRGLAYFSEKQFSKADADMKKAQSLGYKVNPEFLWLLKTVLEQGK